MTGQLTSGRTSALPDSFQRCTALFSVAGLHIGFRERDAGMYKHRSDDDRNDHESGAEVQCFTFEIEREILDKSKY